MWITDLKRNGQVVDVLPCSYLVKTSEENIIRRNRAHLKKYAEDIGKGEL